MLTYAEEKGLYVLEIGWTVALFPWDVLLVHMDTYHTMNSKKISQCQDCFLLLLLYEGILTAVKYYHRRLGLDVKENFVIGDAFVWRYLYKFGVKDIYSCLVKTSETPKCIEKWSKVLAVEIDNKAVFDNIFRTTHEKCLIWFQYKLLYNLISAGRFLFQRQLVDSPVCVFCKVLNKPYYVCFGIAPQSKTTGLMYMDGFVLASHIVLI